VARVDKYLLIRDLCKELAFGAHRRRPVKSQFIQLARVQSVVSPVPGEALLGPLRSRSWKLDTNAYPPAAKVSKKQIAEINIRPDSFHGEWNYTSRPNT
jgi:hypothetical protein